MAIDPNEDIDPLTGQPRVRAVTRSTLTQPAPVTAPLPSSTLRTAPPPATLPPPPPPTLNVPRGVPQRDPNESYADWVARVGYDPFASGTRTPAVQPSTGVGAPINAPSGINPPGDEGTTTAPAAPFTGDLKGFLEAKFGPNFNTLHAGSSSIDQILKYLNDNGIQATRATHAGGLPSDDKIVVNGRTIDLLLGGSSPEQTGGWTWNDITDAGTGGGGTMDAATLQALLSGAGNLSSGTAGFQGGGIPSGGSQGSGLSSLLQQKLSELLNRSTDVSATDPDIAKPLAANRLSEQRSFERDRQMLAERNAAQGFGDSGGAETDLRGLAQDRAAREGQFEGDLYRTAATQRINELMQIVAIAGNQLDASEKNAIAREVAALQAQLQREGLAQHAQEFTADDAFRRLALGQSGLQFDISTAQQQAEFEAQLNQQMLLTLLQGGGA